MNIEKMLAECRAHWEKTKPDAVFADYWMGWQASRESLVIELPERLNEGWQDGDPMEARPDGDWMRSEEVIQAIEATGLKVKP